MSRVKYTHNYVLYNMLYDVLDTNDRNYCECIEIGGKYGAGQLGHVY